MVQDDILMHFPFSRSELKKKKNPSAIICSLVSKKLASQSGWISFIEFNSS